MSRDIRNTIQETNEAFLGKQITRLREENFALECKVKDFASKVNVLSDQLNFKESVMENLKSDNDKTLKELRDTKKKLNAAHTWMILLCGIAALLLVVVAAFMKSNYDMIGLIDELNGQINEAQKLLNK